MNNQKTRKSRMSSVAAENRKCTNMRMSKKATRSRAPMTKSETVNNIVNIHNRHIRDKCYVRVRVRKKEKQAAKTCDILIDSGNNSVTLMTPEFLEYLDPQAKLLDLPDDLKTFTTAGKGQRLKPLGVLEKPVEIEFFSPNNDEKRIKRCKIQPVIVQNLAYNILFSFRDLADFGCKINPLRNQECLEFHQFKPPLIIPMFEKRKHQMMATVHSCQKIKIKPGTEVVFPATSGFSENLKSVNNINRPVFFEPDDEEFHKAGLMALGSIDKIGEKDQIRVRAWNPTENMITIPCHTALGKAYRFNDEPNDYVVAAIAKNVNKYVESQQKQRRQEDEISAQEQDSGYESGAGSASSKNKSKKTNKIKKHKQQKRAGNRRNQNSNSTNNFSWSDTKLSQKEKRFFTKAAESVRNHAIRFDKKLPADFGPMSVARIVRPEINVNNARKFTTANKEMRKQREIKVQNSQARRVLKGFERKLWNAFKYDEHNENLTMEEKIRICKRIGVHRKAFALTEEDVGLVEGVDLEIPTGDHPPIKEKCRPMNPIVQEQLKKQLKDWEKKAVIRKSKGEWAAGIVPVRKKDGTFRFCIDYRKLNSITKVAARPIANMMDKLARLKGPANKPLKIFAKFDMRDAYFCCRIKKEDIPKTGFITPLGSYEYLRQPFGLSGGPGNFHRVVQLLENGMLTRDNSILSHIACYFDDAIVGADNLDELLDKIDVFMETVIETGLRLAIDKCSVAESSISWLGHVISKDGIMPDYNLVRTIKEWEAPDTNEQLLSLFGMLNYFRSFVRLFSAKTSEITELIKRAPTWRKGRKPAPLIGEYAWNDKCQEQLNALLDELTSPPILNHPIFLDPKKGGQFVICVDSSTTAIGCGLAQRQLVTNPLTNKSEWRDVMIAYGSRKLTEPQSKWGSYKLELHGLAVACQNFRYYLLTGGPSVDGEPGGGHVNIVRTDHKGLEWLQKTSNNKVSREIFRMKQHLTDYNLDIVWTPASKMGLADALSRKTFKEGDWGSLDELAPLREERWDSDFFKENLEEAKTNTSDEFWVPLTERSITKQNTVQESSDPISPEVGLIENNCCVTTRSKTRNQNLNQEGGEKDEEDDFPAENNNIEDLIDEEEADNIEEEEVDEFEPPEAEFLEPEDTWAELTVGPPPEALDKFEIHHPKEGPSWWLSDMLRSIQKTDPICKDIIKCLKGDSEFPRTKAQTKHRIELLYGPLVIGKENMTKEDREIAACQQDAQKMYKQARKNSFELKKINIKDNSPTLVINKELDGRKRQLLVIPKDMRILMLQSCHHAQGSFHLGIDRSTEQCLLHMWWPDVKETATKYISGCLVCQNGKKIKSRRGPGLGQTTSRPHERLTNFSCDLVKFPKGRGGYQNLFTLCCMATGWMDAWALRRTSAQAICKILENDVFPRYGEGLIFTMDRGSEFTSKIMKQIMEKHKSKIHLGCSYLPQSNPIERFHRTLNSLIRCHLLDANLPKERWPEVLAKSLYTMRCAPDKDSKLSPFYRVYGKHPCTEMSTWLGRNPNEHEEIIDEEVVDSRRHQINNHPYPTTPETFRKPVIEEEDEESILVKTGDARRELQKVTIGNKTYLAEVNSVNNDNFTQEWAQAKRDLAAKKRHQKNKRRYDVKVQPKFYAPIVGELLDWYGPTDLECPNNRKMSNRWRGPFVVLKRYHHPHVVQCASLNLETGVLDTKRRRDIAVEQLRPTLQLSFRSRPRKDWKPHWLPKS